MKIFLNILLLAGNTCFISIILIPIKLSFNEWFTASCILGGFYTKMQIDKIDLENKIFELKELIKKL